VPTPLTIEFLGTGTSSGVPMIGCNCEVCTSTDPKDNRLRSSILVRSKETTLVVDTTPDFRYQMLRTKTKKMDAVLFTHSHKDHIAGLDDIRPFNFFTGNAIQVFASEMTQKTLQSEFYYAFADHKYPGVPEIKLNTIYDEPFNVNDITVNPVSVWHHRMPVLGFRFNNFTYITDANRIDEVEKDKIRGSEVIVLNALRKEKHISHFTLDEAIAMVRELNVEKAYFTHISHQLGTHAAVSKILPPNIYLAYDGLAITV
jgi:phosphoribosyl 1,2-cyclic phosphate phosphodiesterase